MLSFFPDPRGADLVFDIRDWRRSGDETAFKVYWDKARDLGFVSPRPSSEEVAAFYAVCDYYTHGPGGHGDPVARGRPGLKLLAKLAWRFDNNLYPDKNWWRAALGTEALSCLEIGCGNAANLKALRELGHQVTGVEPDPAARQVGTRMGLDIHPGTAEDMPAELKGCHFDVVVMTHVLEHCIDPVTALTSVRNHLKSGGRFVVQVPNNRCLGLKTFGRHWAWLDVPRHLTFFTENSLRKTLEAAGFLIETTEYYGYFRQFTESWASEQDAIAKSLDGGTSGGFGVYLVYFMTTVFAAPERRYDSIQMIARVQ